MFKVEKNNAKIGAYLADLINQKYESRRAFCRAYISANGEEPTNETINNMSNRLAQIAKGNKAIQTYDLPYFTELLGVSCEQILSAGECSAYYFLKQWQGRRQGPAQSTVSQLSNPGMSGALGSCLPGPRGSGSSLNGARAVTCGLQEERKQGEGRGPHWPRHPFHPMRHPSGEPLHG